MRRRAKPAKAKVEAKLPVVRKSPMNDAKVRDLEKRLAEALEREAGALEQQTATAEILRVISGSLTDLQPVFDVIVSNALRLCDGLFSTLFRFDGELITLARLLHLLRLLPLRYGRCESELTLSPTASPIRRMSTPVEDGWRRTSSCAVHDRLIHHDVSGW